MPIFQDDLDSPALNALAHNSPVASPPQPVSIEPPPHKLRRLSEESLRTEFCEGPVPDSPRATTPPDASDFQNDTATSDRAELIERLKRGQSPTWVPSRHVGSLFQDDRPKTPTKQPQPDQVHSSSGLLPAVELTPEKDGSQDSHEDRWRDGLEIERPRSALHRGDFRHQHTDFASTDTTRDTSARVQPDARLGIDKSWFSTSPPRNFTPFRFERRGSGLSEHVSSSRIPVSPSSSFTSSPFAYQPPTTPLVQSESNEDLDDMTRDSKSERIGLYLNGLQHPNSPVGTSYISHAISATASRRSLPSRTPLHRREGSLPYQAHQPRRSLTSTPSMAHPSSSPQTPSFLRSRRTSFSSEASPIQHASMVGSYEESILRGRMSTTPSKPLDFLAQIGVLGRGDCRPGLRCPQHVTLPFSAVYYSYNVTAVGRSQSEDGPSPYVGQIDLENGLPDSEELNKTRRKAQSRGVAGQADTRMMANSGTIDPPQPSAPRRRGSRGPRAPPGGCYRIPQQGQVQIVIKNQNKTAVKLFLIPYDLTGMEVGTKTFIRQRSYSAGSAIDEISQVDSSASLDRPVLRYLIHLHVCCPSRGRYYLYKSIRVVFANRVPDGKESLRNETTWPEPRYSPYKPVRVMRPPLSGPSSSSAAATALTADKAYRRRSLGVSVGTTSHSFSPTLDYLNNGSPAHTYTGGHTRLVDPVPFRLPSRQSDMSDNTTSTTVRSPETISRPSTIESVAGGSGDVTSSVLHQSAAERYEKLKKGDHGYGGASLWRGHPGTEGLLSQQLQGLGVRMKTDGLENSPERGRESWINTDDHFWK